MMLELLIVFLLHEQSGADINPLDKIYNVKVNEDVSIPWIYDYESDMFNVEWSFKNSSSTTVILTKVLTNPAQVQNSFNIQHDGNGNITLKKVTSENKGIYYCKVLYTQASARATVTGTATLDIIYNECSCKCMCRPCKDCQITNGIAISLKILFVGVSIGLIKHGIIQYFGATVVIGLNKFDIGILTFGNAGSFIFGAIVAGYGLGGQHVSNCTDCPCDCKGYCECKDCETCFWLAIVTFILAVVLIIVTLVFIMNRNGWCGERFSCLNRVLPVCKDTEQRGPPDGKPDSHAAKEKRREVTHNEQHDLKETGVHKDKPNKEKHEEPSKGRPLPQPTGSNRPMPEIPSDRHRRGLSANFHDDRDTPLDDNLLHTLPVVKKPKNALDPMNPEGQSKNLDDQPKKKKKKKKDRDTSRSDEIEDN